MAGNVPAIGLKVQVDGVQSAAEKLKAARAEVKQIQKDIAQAAKDGKNVEDQFKRLKKAQDEVANLKTAMKGGSPSGIARGGGSFQFNTARSVSSGGRMNLGSEVRGISNDARDVGGIFNGLSTGGVQGTTEALRSASGLIRGKFGAIGNLAVPLALAASAVQEYGEGMADIDKSYKSTYGAFNTIRGLEDLGGGRATIKRSEFVKNQYRKDVVNNLGAFDNFAQESRLFNTSIAGFSLKGVTDYFGLTTRLGELDEKAEEKLGQEIDKAKARLKEAAKAAELGDIARAQSEQDAARGETSPAGRGEVSRLIAAQGTPTEQYMRAQNVRRFNSEYTQLWNKRGNPRTGDKD